MSGSTLCKIGQWNPSNDAFGAHPACPTGAIYDLNDGTNWSLEDANGKGNAINWGNPVPTILESSNPRTVGARVTRRVYNQNRKVQVRLFLGQAASYTTFITNLHNLTELCEGITADQPAALLLQPAGSSTPLYADVLEAHLATKVEELKWIQLVQDGVIVEFTCRPFLRGNRQWLQNLAVNPGFEAPSGPGVTVFSDPLSNTNAYSVQAGGALTQADKTYYSDVVISDNPLRYYRLDEASGTTTTDARASGNNGTITGGVTLGTTGLLTGDTDKAMTFNGTTGYINLPGTGLPSGNNAWTIDGLVKTPASFSSTMQMASFGVAGTTRGCAQVYVDNTGNAHAGTYSGDTAGYALSASTVYHLAATWDGTTLTLYVNGVARQTATPGTLVITPTYAEIGALAQASPNNFWNGVLDEVAFYGTCLSAARISAHYTAATTTPPTNAASVIIPANGRVSFGSSVWGAINTWQTKFRYFTGLTGTWYLHYTDATNYLAVTLTTGANGFQLIHVIGGVTNTLAQASPTLVNEVGYFVQITQFPVLSGYAPSLQAILSVDNGSGSPGTALATLSGSTSDTVTALSGAPQLAASGTGLTILQNQVSLFGPGAWWWKSDTGTGTASGAWQTTSANTYPSGPVTSFGAAVTTAAPAGTLDCYWASYNPASTATILATAYPIGTGVTFPASVYLTSTGLANSCAQSLRLVEFDSSGNLLRSTTLQSVVGNQASWTQLAGSVATGASTAYVGLQLRAVDATNASVNGTITWDNCQWWNQTQTGMAAMPYCELRFPQSPAQLVVSGLVGDTPAPCWIALGTQYTSLGNGVTAYVGCGRRAQVGAGAQLIGWQTDTTSTFASFVLDSASYGGHYSQYTNAIVADKSILATVNQHKGVYHLYFRFQTNQSSGNLSSVKGTATATMGPVGTSIISITTATSYPVTTQNAWAWLDVGVISVPVITNGGLIDPTTITQSSTPQFTDPNLGGGITQKNGAAFLFPLDAQTLLLSDLNNGGSFTNWAWWYSDGTAVEGGGSATQTVSSHATPIPNVTGGAGNLSGAWTLTNLLDPYLILDPSLATGTAGNQQGVNQCIAYSTDSNGTIYNVYADIQYSPLYLQPK